MHDGAEVHRLIHREHLTKTAVAERSGTSRNTVVRLLAAPTPPRYSRAPAGSALDPHAEAIAAVLGADPKVPATVVLERLRRAGYSGGTTILREHLARVCPAFVAARAYQRTTCLPGERGLLDWWCRSTGGTPAWRCRSARRCAGRPSGSWPPWRTRPPTPPCSPSGAPPATSGPRARLPGAPGRGGRARRDRRRLDRRLPRWRARPLARRGGRPLRALGLKPRVLRPRRPEAKGQVERTIDYLERSFLPLRDFEDLGDLQAQHDAGAAEVAFSHHHHRVGSRVGDAWRAERGSWRRCARLGPRPTATLRCASSRTASCAWRAPTTPCLRSLFDRRGHADHSTQPVPAAKATAALDDATAVVEGVARWLAGRWS